MNDSRVVRARLLIDGARKLLTEVQDEQPRHQQPLNHWLRHAVTYCGLGLECVQEIEREPR